MKWHCTRRRALAAIPAGLSVAAGCGRTDTSPADESPGTDNSRHPAFLRPWSPPVSDASKRAAGDTPIRLASWSATTTLNHPRDMSITAMVKRIRDAGYTSGNSYAGMNRRNPWLDAPESDIRELKEALAEYDVTFFDVHTVTNNIHPDPDVREANIAHVVETCECAERVGCPMVTTHAGNRNADTVIGPHPEQWTMETWDMVVASMKEILRRTAGMTVSLGIEAVNMTCMNDPRAHHRLIDDVGDDRLGVCLDPVNMLHLGAYYRTRELIEECFDLFGPSILGAHAKDSYILPNQMSAYITEVRPGAGVVDYETYLACLSNLDRPVTLLIEHIPAEEYPPAKAYIEETARRVGATIYW